MLKHQIQLVAGAGYAPTSVQLMRLSGSARTSRRLLDEVLVVLIVQISFTRSDTL